MTIRRQYQHSQCWGKAEKTSPTCDVNCSAFVLSTRNSNLTIFDCPVCMEIVDRPIALTKRFSNHLMLHATKIISTISTQSILLQKLRNYAQGTRLLKSRATRAICYRTTSLTLRACANFSHAAPTEQTRGCGEAAATHTLEVKTGGQYRCLVEQPVNAL